MSVLRAILAVILILAVIGLTESQYQSSAISSTHELRPQPGPSQAYHSQASCPPPSNVSASINSEAKALTARYKGLWLVDQYYPDSSGVYPIAFDNGSAEFGYVSHNGTQVLIKQWFYWKC